MNAAINAKKVYFAIHLITGLQFTSTAEVVGDNEAAVNSTSLSVYDDLNIIFNHSIINIIPYLYFYLLLRRF